MEFNFDIDWVVGIPEIFIFVMINFFIVYSVSYSTSPDMGYPILVRNVVWLGVHILFFALLLNFLNPIHSAIGFKNLLIFDDFAIVVKGVVLI